MNTTSLITNDYFKDHDTFKKYPELFITDEYISYIDSLNIKQRSDLCEEYSKTLLTKEDLLENGLVNFQKHPELMFQKCLLIYGSKLKYPVNFLEIIHFKYRRFMHKKVYIHYIDNKTGKEKRCFLMRFLRGQALDYQERFGFNPFYNLPKLIDLIFPDKSVSLIKKEGNQIYMECTLINCPYRTETCYKWHTTLGTLTAAFKKKAKNVQEL